LQPQSLLATLLQFEKPQNISINNLILSYSVNPDSDIFLAMQSSGSDGFPLFCLIKDD